VPKALMLKAVSDDFLIKVLLFTGGVGVKD